MYWLSLLEALLLAWRLFLYMEEVSLFLFLSCPTIALCLIQFGGVDLRIVIASSQGDEGSRSHLYFRMSALITVCIMLEQE